MPCCRRSRASKVAFSNAASPKGARKSCGRRQLSLLSRLLQHQQDALKSQGKAKTLGRWTAQGFRESVVSPASDQRILCAQCSTRDLESGSRVVVQATDKTGHDGERNLTARQIAQELVEVGSAGLV